MSIRRLVAPAGALVLAFAAAPMGALHPQTTPRQDSASHRQWGWVIPGPTSAVPESTTTPQAQAAVKADSAFIRQAAEGNLFEIRLGNVAKTKGTNPAVKQFAQRMVTDHTTMQNQWGALVARTGLPIKASLDPAHEQGALQLERLSGAEFDRVYMTSMIQAHQRDLNAFQTQGPSAQSAEVRQMAASGLSTIQQHLNMARQVGSQVGATPGVATAPQNPPTATNQPGQVTTQNGAEVRQPGKGRKDDSKADREFVLETLQDNVLEIRLAQLAERKASKPAVKEFAQRMASDFARLHDRWSGVATGNGTSVETAMGPKHREKLDRLQKVSGAKFDRAYISTVIEHLESIVPYFQKEGRASSSPQVRKMVDEELPILRRDLAQAKRIGDQVNVSSR